MPRIYTSESYPVDYCRNCFPKTEKEAFELHGHNGDGPDGRGNCFGYDDEAPFYPDTDYECHKCGKRLKAIDHEAL